LNIEFRRILRVSILMSFPNRVLGTNLALHKCYLFTANAFFSKKQSP